MDWNLILNEIIKVSVVPLLSVITGYLVKFIKAKMQDLQACAKNETVKKYINLLSQTITECVMATNQTYTDSLKEQNAFDAAAQKEAFNKTYKAVMSILTSEAKEYLANIYGDLDAYITQKIEAEVYTNHFDYSDEEYQELEP